LRLEVARLAVKLVARQAAANLYGELAFREDGDAMMRALSMPERRVAGVFELRRRTFLVGRLDFLEADDVRPRLVQPFEEPRQPAVDAVDVVGGDLQRGLCGCAAA
jgi:hypothetical protein